MKSLHKQSPPTVYSQQILDISIPANIVVATYHPLEKKYLDPCFYPTGLLADIRIANTPINIELLNEGETSAAYFQSPDEEPTTLKYYDEFMATFPEGDTQLSSSPTILEWDMNPWFDLYQSPLRQGENCYAEHLDIVNHDITEALQDAINEAQSWEPYLHLLQSTCPEKELIAAVLSEDYKAREAALGNPARHESVLTAATLAPPLPYTYIK